MIGIGRHKGALAALLVTGALAGAGCGGDDEGGGGGGGDDALAQAKQTLVDQCHAGHENDQADLELCQCAADELEKNHGYDKAKFDAAVAQAKKGSLPPEIIQALSACKNK